MSEEGIYLTAALCCEKILEEKDNVVSVIRAIDYVTAWLPAGAEANLSEAQFAPATVFFLLSLRSATFQGKKAVHIRVRHPNDWMPVLETEFELDLKPLDTHNYNLEIPLNMQTPGLLWIEVSLDDRLFCATPFEIRHTVGDESQPTLFRTEREQQRTPDGQESGA